MKLKELYEQIDPDKNPEHNKIHLGVRNDVCGELADLIRSEGELDVPQIQNLLISLGKTTQILPYGPMDEIQEKKLRDKIKAHIGYVYKEPTKENLLKFEKEWNEFWRVMISPGKDLYDKPNFGPKKY